VKSAMGEVSALEAVVRSTANRKMVRRADAGRAHSDVFMPRQQSWFGQQLSTAAIEVSEAEEASDPMEASESIAIMPWHGMTGFAICRLQCSPILPNECASATVPKAGTSITNSRNLAVQRYICV